MDDDDSNKLRFNISKAIRLKLDNEHWYEHVRKLVANHVMESTSANRQEPTSLTKPVIIIHDNVEGASMLILRGLSPRANYTDRAAAAGRRS